MELETTKAFLKAQDLSRVENVVLIHLSERNSDEGRFVNEIVGLVGKPVVSAKEGVMVDFNRKLF